MLNLERYRLIENWREENLLDLPNEETDYYEYKSSKTPLEKLKLKIVVAASAFWNSGGGIFIAGIDDNGKIDGGTPAIVGKQRLRDWVDQILASVEPIGPYAVNTIAKENPDSLIKDNHVVLVIAFGESHLAPHMAPDRKYYVRAGTHSGPASHYLVEAIRLRRSLEKPLLRGLLKIHEQRPNIVELVIITANDVTALNVVVNLEPLPIALAKHFRDKFPLHISVIDQEHPFSMDGSSPQKLYHLRLCLL